MEEASVSLLKACVCLIIIREQHPCETDHLVLLLCMVEIGFEGYK